MEDEKLWSRAGTGGMGNTCAGLSGPIGHRSTWGAISRNGGNAALLTVAMGDWQWKWLSQSQSRMF